MFEISGCLLIRGRPCLQEKLYKILRLVYFKIGASLKDPKETLYNKASPN